MPSVCELTRRHLLFRESNRGRLGGCGLRDQRAAARRSLRRSASKRRSWLDRLASGSRLHRHLLIEHAQRSIKRCQLHFELVTSASNDRAIDAASFSSVSSEGFLAWRSMCAMTALLTPDR